MQELYTLRAIAITSKTAKSIQIMSGIILPPLVAETGS